MTINGFFAPAILGTSGVVNPIAGASLAYSTRRINPLYGGPALRAWRVSDNAVQDIGFTGSDLNLASLIAFVGAGAGVQGRMLSWYDQAGNGNLVSVIGGAGGSGPRLITAGAPTATIGGKSAPKFILGSDINMGANFGSNVLGANAGTIFAVMNAATGGNGNSVDSQPDGGDSNRGLFSVNGGNPTDSICMAFASSAYPGSPSVIMNRNAAIFFPQQWSVPYTFGTSVILAMRYDVTAAIPSKGYVGGGTAGTNPSTDPYDSALTAFSLFAGLSAAFDGLLAEFVMWPTQLSIADANAFGANQAAYWGATWTPISDALPTPTWNGATRNNNITLDVTNLIAAASSAADGGILANYGRTSTKRYIEFTWSGTPAGVDTGCGFARDDVNFAQIGPSPIHAVMVYDSGHVWNNNVYTGAGNDLGSMSPGDVIRGSLNLDAKTVVLAKNGGVPTGSIDISAWFTGAHSVLPAASFNATGINIVANFGGSAFAFPVTPGYTGGW